MAFFKMGAEKVLTYSMTKLLKAFFPYLALPLLLAPTPIQAQSDTVGVLQELIVQAEDDSLRCEYRYRLARELLGQKPDQSKALLLENLNWAKEKNQELILFKTYRTLGLAHYYLAEYIEALESWKKALPQALALNDLVGAASLESNIGAVFMTRGVKDSATVHFLKSLALAEQTRDSMRMMTVLTNIGALYNTFPDRIDEAIEYNQRALSFATALGDDQGTATAALNLGEILTVIEEYEKASESFELAASSFQDPDGQVAALTFWARSLLSLGKVEEAKAKTDSAIDMDHDYVGPLALCDLYTTRGSIEVSLSNCTEALRYFHQAERLIQEEESPQEAERLFRAMRNCLRETGQYEEALEVSDRLLKLQQELYNVEANKKLSEQLQQLEVDKAGAEVKLLKFDQALQNQTIQNQRLSLAALALGLILVAVFLVVVFLQRRQIATEKATSDSLLLNILPAEVAVELKEKGNSDAKLFSKVTVLFTDFKDFTKSAEAMAPEELVRTLNTCFKAFDEIMTKHGVEKIKTIGDAYLAAAGLPKPGSAGAREALHAALEMQDYLRMAREEGFPFEMRIGLHTGAVVAGIVGVKKFQYDIWGDTVNTAARMESAGEVGRVNVSEQTYMALQGEAEFRFEARGALPAKGKGELKMWFADLA